MKKELKQIFITVKIVLGILCPVSAYAAQVAFDKQLASISLLSLAMTVMLSTVMGATALLHAMTQEYRTNGGQEIQRLALFISSRMLSSNAAGILVFFAVESWDIPTGYRAGAIMLAAFGGTWTIERAMLFFAEKFTPIKQPGQPGA